MDGLETPTKNPIAQNAALRSPPDQLLLFPFMFLLLISPEKNETLFLFLTSGGTILFEPPFDYTIKIEHTETCVWYVLHWRSAP